MLGRSGGSVEEVGRVAVAPGDLVVDEAGFHFRAPARHQGGQPVLVGDAEPAVRCGVVDHHLLALVFIPEVGVVDLLQGAVQPDQRPLVQGSEEQTSELQYLMRISYAVVCLKKKTKVILIDT